MVNITDRKIEQNLVTQSGKDPDSELKHCVQEQSVVFTNAVSVIEQLEDAAKQRTLGTADSVSQLQKSLDQVVAAQQRVSAAHLRFTQTKFPLNHELRTILGQHEVILNTLISRIDHLQKTFESVRNDLMPQLDVESRRRNMHAAYQQSMKTV